MVSEHGKEQHMIANIAADARESEEQEDRFMILFSQLCP
jgi:hypothetical protein